MSIDLIETRRLIEEIAERLGAARMTIYKWRERGVPSAWQIRIVEASNKMLTFADFEKIPPFRNEGHVAARSQENEAQSSEDMKGAA